MSRTEIEKFAKIVMMIRGDKELRECLAVLMEQKIAHTLEVSYLTRKTPKLVARKLNILTQLGFLNKKSSPEPQDETDTYYYSNGLTYAFSWQLRGLLRKEIRKVRIRLKQVDLEPQNARISG